MSSDSADSAETSSAASSDTAGTKECPFCAETIKALAKKCKHCGEWLPGEEQAAPAAPASRTTAAAVTTPPPSPRLEPGQVLDLLSALVDKNLAVLEEDEKGQGRYRLLETVRQYACERLASSEDGDGYHCQHRDYFLALAEEAKEALGGPEQAHWLDVLESEHDNLRRAITFCLEEEARAESVEGEKGLRLGWALQRFWGTRGYLGEGRESLAALLSRPLAQARTRARAGALLGAGNLAESQGDFTSARSLFAESLAIRRELGDRSGIAASLNSLGNLASTRGEQDSARSLYEESLAIRRELGDENGTATCLNNLGYLAFYRGDAAAAGVLYEQSLAIYRELGKKNSIATCLTNLGFLAVLRGDFVRARALYEEGLLLNKQLGLKGDMIWGALGDLAAREGRDAEARRLWHACLREQKGVGNRAGIITCLEGIAVVALSGKSSSPDVAVRLLGAAASVRAEIGFPRATVDQAEYDDQVSAAHQVLGEEAFAVAWAEGRAMNLEQAVEYALGELEEEA